MNSRGLCKAFRCSEKDVAAAIRSAPAQRRCFTRSSVCEKQVPTFLKTSSSDLDNLLASFRDAVFIPANLTKSHQKLVFSNKHRKTLEEETVMANVGTEKIRLAHVNRLTDQPGKTRGLFEAVELMETKQDWDNLPLLLRGLKDTSHDKNKYLKLSTYEKLVRKAGQAGRQDVIVECLRQGVLTLKSSSLIREIMFWIQYQAVQSKWDNFETKKALRLAEQVVLLVSDDAVKSGRIVTTGHSLTQPEIIGILLELSAQVAKPGGKDAPEKVRKYADRLIGVMQKGAVLSADIPRQDLPWQTSNWLLRDMLPVIYGARAAKPFLDESTETAKKLAGVEERLAVRADEIRQQLLIEKSETSAPLGLWLYDHLMGGGEAKVAPKLVTEAAA